MLRGQFKLKPGHTFDQSQQLEPALLLRNVLHDCVVGRFELVLDEAEFVRTEQFARHLAFDKLCFDGGVDFDFREVFGRVNKLLPECGEFEVEDVVFAECNLLSFFVGKIYEHVLWEEAVVNVGVKDFLLFEVTFERLDCDV